MVIMMNKKPLNRIRAGTDLVGADLKGVDLKGVDLRNAQKNHKKDKTRIK